MSKLKQIKCPACGRRGDWFEKEWGPFCSRRCKLVDLGRWFNEEHHISEPLRPDAFQGYEDLPPGTQLDDPGSDDFR